ncbi:MAG TPA: hypothetical protein VK034_25170 [Enhygromyxa sp.]|nr:hypothetical protein [Enhygromyxa sp.]
MVDSNHNEGVRIDNLRLQVPAGPRFAGLGSRDGEQLARQIAERIELPGSELVIDRMQLRIHEHELGAAPAEAIARAINQKLRGGGR